MLFKHILYLFCDDKQERSCGLGADTYRLHALRYLLIQLLLQVLLRSGEYSEAASELVICCKKVFSTVDRPDNSGEDDLDVDTAPELMDVLVDTLLSLLPQSSAPMRSSIEQVRKCSTMGISFYTASLLIFLMDCVRDYNIKDLLFFT